MVIEKDIIQRSAGYRKHIYESSPSWNPWHRVRWIFERILVQASCRMFENYPNTFKTHSRKILSFHACTVLDVLSFLWRIFVSIFFDVDLWIAILCGELVQKSCQFAWMQFLFKTIPHFFKRFSKFYCIQSCNVQKMFARRSCKFPKRILARGCWGFRWRIALQRPDDPEEDRKFPCSGFMLIF